MSMLRWDRIFILAVILVILASTDVKSIEKGHPVINSSIPLQIIKEFPKNMDLIDSTGKVISFSRVVENGDIAGVFISSKRCLQCEPGFFFWKKLVGKNTERINGIAIMLTEEKNVLQRNSHHKLKIYRPLRLEDFKRSFSILNSQARVFFLKNKKAIYFNHGDLNCTEFFKIRDLIKGETRNK